ncbi:MAG: hypothetical protein DWQ08_10600, partial [Proteobacteria bacterium]
MPLPRPASHGANRAPRRPAADFARAAFFLLLVTTSAVADGWEESRHDDERFVECLYHDRAWLAPEKQPRDPIRAGIEVAVPKVPARTRVIGIDEDMLSLAWKIHLIENARHTIDLAYYIFDRDTVGYAMLGALCAAVRRGVDVRLVVDS